MGCITDERPHPCGSDAPHLTGESDMARKGPFYTLLGGLAVAAVLIALDVRATSSTGRPTAGEAAPPAATTGATPTASAPTASTPTASVPTGTGTATGVGQATYAGAVDGSTASLAIAVHDGVAIGYLCTGSVESWLQGSASGGQLSLAGSHSGRLAGTYGGGVAAGTVWAAGKRWTFHISAVSPPSGLYKGTATIRGARVVGSWIVLPDGRQVGLLVTNDNPGTAPALDTTTRTATIDGAPLPVSPVDGVTGSGF
jgi:hypothetical protein